MKKILALILAACLMMGAACALASVGNVTIAISGQNGFDDTISSMMVWGNRLLLAGFNNLYAWDSETRELVQVEGYDKLASRLTGNDGEPPVLELEDNEYCYLDSDIYIVNDKMYRRANVGDGEGNTTSLLVEIVIADDGALSFGDIIDLGDALCVTEEYDGQTYSYVRSLNNPCAVGNTLYGLSYDTEMEMFALDLDSGTVDTMALDTDYEIQSLSPYTEGKLLMIGCNYNVDPIETVLLIYDTETEEITELGIMPSKDYETPTSICYDAARSKVYYVLSGSVWRMDISDSGFGTPEEFGDMPINSYSNSNSPAVLMGDWYVVSSYDGVVGRDVTLDKLPAQRLRISNGGYVSCTQTAYYAFTDKHPEYMVSISDSSEEDTLLQSMMNRDSSVDIFTISSTSSVLSALRSRGYLAELNSSEKLMKEIGTLYPFIQDFCMKDGNLYLLPIDGFAYTLTIDTKTLTEKLGYTESDIPTSWKQFFELLADIADNRKLEDVPEVSISNLGSTRDDFRSQLFTMMLNNYNTWLEQDDANLSKGTPVLLELCAAFEKVDWDNLGLPEEYDSESWTIYSDKTATLFGTNNVSASNYISAEGDELSIPLSVVDGEEPVIDMTMTVAFVNPFSENRDAAVEYLEDMWDCIDRTDKLNMDPNDNEPVINRYYETNLKNIQNSIDESKKSLEKMTDEEARESLQSDIASMEEWLKEYEQSGKYDVTPEQIARYREAADQLVVARSNIYDSYDQVSQYLDGVITANQFATQMEKTLQMQRLEGN